MTSGIEGTGPYARLKDLRREAKNCRYELGLIEQGHKRQYGAKHYQRILKDILANIKLLNAELKTGSAKS